MKKMVNLVEFENQLDLGAPNGDVDDGLVLMLHVVSHEKMPTIVNAM
jgi:hypothetical protein